MAPSLARRAGLGARSRTGIAPQIAHTPCLHCSTLARAACARHATAAGFPHADAGFAGARSTTGHIRQCCAYAIRGRAGRQAAGKTVLGAVTASHIATHTVDTMLGLALEVLCAREALRDCRHQAHVGTVGLKAGGGISVDETQHRLPTVTQTNDGRGVNVAHAGRQEGGVPHRLTFRRKPRAVNQLGARLGGPHHHRIYTVEGDLG